MPKRTSLENLTKVSEVKQNIAASPVAIAPPGYYQIMDIPSKFAFYPEGTRIYVKKFTTHQCKLLADHLENGSDEFDGVLNAILEECIKGISISDLILKDRYFIVLFILTMTYPASKFYVPWVCAHCGKDNKYSLDMQDIETEDFDITNPIVDIVADESTFDYSPTTVEKKEFIQSLINQYGKENLDDLYLYIIKNISKLDGETDLLQIYNNLATLPPADTMIITATLDDYDFGTIPEVITQCEHCKESGRMAIRFHGAFFMPKFIGRTKSI
jgi:hypothetical protein